MTPDRLKDYPSLWAAVSDLAPKLNVGAETLRKRVCCTDECHWRGGAPRGLDVVVGKPCPREFRDDVVRVAPGRDLGVTASKRIPVSATLCGTERAIRAAQIRVATAEVISARVSMQAVARIASGR